MARKSIIFDLEAYGLLCSVRKANESVSQAIMRVVKSPFDYEAFRKRAEGLSISEKADKATEEQIQNRHRSSNREY